MSSDILAVLDQHQRTTVSTNWNGCPSSNWWNIKRHCICGELVERNDPPLPRSGRSQAFPLGGQAFDAPHREHIARVLASFRPERGAD